MVSPKLTRMLPEIVGTIDRRMLLNVRVDPEIMAKHVPEPFGLQLIDGWAMAGICLIRMVDLKPKFAKGIPGLSSENAAHRIAVTWDDEGVEKSGVYVPRRDTTSRLASIVGGRVFPGVHYKSEFKVKESDSQFELEMISKDGEARVSVNAEVSDDLDERSIFSSLEQASSFYECGSTGYSATNDCNRFDGMYLDIETWSVKPLMIRKFESSMFDSFPEGSVEIDNGLLMSGLKSNWHAIAQKQAS